MAWKATGQPTVRKQRDKWVVRVDGIDIATGEVRPRQLGSYASQRAANSAAREVRETGRTTEKGTVSWLARRYVTGRPTSPRRPREQYAWVIPHIEGGRGAIPLPRLERDEVAS